MRVHMLRPACASLVAWREIHVSVHIGICRAASNYHCPCCRHRRRRRRRRRRPAAAHSRIFAYFACVQKASNVSCGSARAHRRRRPTRVHVRRGGGERERDRQKMPLLNYNQRLRVRRHACPSVCNALNRRNIHSGCHWVPGIHIYRGYVSRFGGTTHKPCSAIICPLPRHWRLTGCADNDSHRSDFIRTLTHEGTRMTMCQPASEHSLVVCAFLPAHNQD